jgi:hypothetical protein
VRVNNGPYTATEYATKALNGYYRHTTQFFTHTYPAMQVMGIKRNKRLELIKNALAEMKTALAEGNTEKFEEVYSITAYRLKYGYGKQVTATQLKISLH